MTEKGKKSIIGFGLKRPALNEKRYEHLERVKMNDLLARIDLTKLTAEHVRLFAGATHEQIVDIVHTASRFMQTAAGDAAEFAGMVRAKFPELPR